MTMEEGNPAPDSADPALHELYRRWSRLAARGPLPSADDMKFDDLAAEFPGAAMIEVQQRPDASRRYCYARVGSNHTKSLGREIEGYSIDELVAPQQIAHFESVYDRIVEEGRPHYWMRMNMPMGSDVHTFERLLVPVADDGETVDALIGIWVWFDLES